MTLLLATLENADHELLLSAASSWEIAIKHDLGRLRLPQPPELFMPDRLRASGVVPVFTADAAIAAYDVAVLRVGG